MRFKLPINLKNQDADEDFVRFVTEVLDLLGTIINGNIGFLDNCKTGFVIVTFANANTQQAVPHGLGKIPSGYLTARSASTGVVYDGTTPATAQYIYLRCSTAEKKTLLIF